MKTNLLLQWLTLSALFCLLALPLPVASAQNASPTTGSQDKSSDEKQDDDQSDDDESEKQDSPEDKKPESDQSDSQGDEEAEKKEKKKEEPESRRRRPRRTSSSRDERFSKRSKKLVATFEPIAASVSQSTVKILSGPRKRPVALGMIVDAEGLILTKASELKGELTCKFADGRQATATVFGVHDKTDLALLKVDIDQISSVQWSEEPAPIVGQWLATPYGRTSNLDIGIVAVNQRSIPASKPFIGIVMDDLDGRDGVKINQVVPDSPADDSNIMVNEIITHIDNIEIINVQGLRDTLGQYDPNYRVTLKIIRAGEEKKLNLTLASRDKINPGNNRSNQQNSMGSTLSRRRKNFPNAFQHDTALTATTCGGPIVDLSGNVVGVNIARAGRVSSLALPAETVMPVLTMLKSGQLSPAIINQQKIADIDAQLAELTRKIGNLPERKNSLTTKHEVEKAKKAELEKILKDVQDRLKVIELKSETFEKELDSVTKDMKNFESTRKRLENDRKRLSTGLR